MTQENLDIMLINAIKEKLKGKESHPAYQRWVDEEFNVSEKHLDRLIPDLKQFIDISGKYILDFGCGTAGSSVALGLNGANVVGIEPSLLSIKAAKIRIEKHNLQNTVEALHIEDTKKLLFNDETFDICACHSVLEYIPGKRDGYIKEMWRTLKKGGYLFIGGTSNGIYPNEMHTKRLFANYFCDRNNPDEMPIGISYWDILGALRSFEHEVMNKTSRPSGLNRFIERTKGNSLTGKQKVKRQTMISLFHLIDWLICPIMRVPNDAFMPWVDLCIQKK